MPSGDKWGAELKWDGQRCLARRTGGEIRLWARSLREITASYPDIVQALTTATAGQGDVLLDGELVAPDPDSRTGAPSFARLQRRMHVTRPSTALLAAVRAEFIAFDVLALGTETVAGRPYLERRELLEGLGLDGGRIRVPPYWNLADIDAEQLLSAAADALMEGIVLKRLDSRYQPGQRSPLWLKYPIRRTLEAAIIGYLDGTGANSATLGSLVLAAPDDTGTLRYIGCVGTGFTHAARTTLRAALEKIGRDTSPLTVPAPEAVQRSAHFCEPIFVADIWYRELSPDGVVRHPSFRGIRSDLTVAQLRWPS